MSKLPKIFRFKKKDPKQGTNPSEGAIQKLREMEEMLVKKQEYLENKIATELTIAKKNGRKNKALALSALKRKKRYSTQLQQIDGTLTTIEMQREALESATANTAVLTTMTQAGKALKSATQHLNVDKVTDMMDDIAETVEVAREMSEAISSPLAFGQGSVDEAELEKELEELEQEALDEELLRVGPVTRGEVPPVAPEQLPNVPPPARRGIAEEEEDEDMKALAAWSNETE